MAHFIVYTSSTCSFCTASKGWMLNNGHSYDERNVQKDPVALSEMQAKLPGIKMVPQIFLGTYHIGGYTDLMEAEKNGSLSMLVEESS